MAAEFWALRDGLMLAAQLGSNHLHVELDAQVHQYSRANHKAFKHKMDVEVAFMKF